jgi:VanZ family protein
MMQFLKAKGLFRVYVLFLFLMAIVPIGTEGLNNISILDLRADYILHAVLYLPWVFLCVKAGKALPIWIFWGILFAAGMEGLQYWHPYRAFNINDLVANVFGVAVGASILLRPAFRRASSASR